MVTQAFPWTACTLTTLSVTKFFLGNILPKLPLAQLKAAGDAASSTFWFVFRRLLGFFPINTER